MRSFFNWAAPELELSFRPDKNIKRPRYKAAEIVPFTESEVKRLLKACDRTPEAKTEQRTPSPCGAGTPTATAPSCWFCSTPA